MMQASSRMAQVQKVWRDYNHRGIEIPETWGDFATVWTEYQAAREEEVKATDAYHRECRKAGYIGANNRTQCPHLQS
jgi:hypothetical protein